MADQMSLDGILSDEERKPTEEAPEKEPAGEAAPPKEEAPPVERVQSSKKAHREKEMAAQGRDPATGQFVPKEGEKPTEAPKEEPKPAQATPPAQPEMTPKERAAFAAAADERRKRQALEAELRTLREKPAEQPKPFWDAPDEAIKRMEGLIQANEIKTVVRMTENMARARYPDYNEKITVFAELVQANPGITQPWLSSPDPADYAYKLAKGHMELQAAGGMDQAIAQAVEKARLEERQKVGEELKAKAEALAAEKAKIPTSLSSAPSTGSQRPVWSGPTSLDSILK